MNYTMYLEGGCHDNTSIELNNPREVIKMYKPITIDWTVEPDWTEVSYPVEEECYKRVRKLDEQPVVLQMFSASVSAEPLGASFLNRWCCSTISISYWGPSIFATLPTVVNKTFIPTLILVA